MLVARTQKFTFEAEDGNGETRFYEGSVSFVSPVEGIEDDESGVFQPIEFEPFLAQESEWLRPFDGKDRTLLSMARTIHEFACQSISIPPCYADATVTVRDKMTDAEASIYARIERPSFEVDLVLS